MPSAMTNEAHLDNAVEKLKSQAASKASVTSIKPYVEAISNLAQRQGLSSSALQSLLDLITKPSSLDQSSQNTLLKALYPATKVESISLLTTVSSLGLGKQKPSSTTQSGLVRWLVLVFELIESPCVLSRCYSILFNLLDVLYLRANLCHLLAKITRKKHVKPFRVDMLKRIEEGITRDANITKLISIYECVMPGSFVTPKFISPVTFANPDPIWTETLQSIQLRTSDGSLGTQITTEDFQYGTFNMKDIKVRNGERQSDKLIRPKDVEDVAGKLEKFKICATTCSDLADHLVQQSLSLLQDGDVDSTNDVLAVSLENEIENLDRGEGVNRTLLEQLLSFTGYSKTLSAPGIKFFKSYLPTWRPAIEFENEALILDLLSYLPIMTWHELHATLLRPMENILLDSTIESLTTLTNFYTRLLQHWTTILHQPANQPPTITLIETIQNLTSHTSLLALNTIAYSPTPTLQTLSTVLTHLEAHTALVAPPLSLPLPPPQPILIYTLLFTSPSLSTVSRTSAILARYKDAFEKSSVTTTTRNPQDIQMLNAVLIDTCNLLLRSRAFNMNDTHAKACLVTPPLAEALTKYAKSLSPPLDLSQLYSLSYHPALAGLSSAAFREVENEADVEIEHEGPVSNRSLNVLGKEGGIKMSWREYRVHVLKWLEDVGADGIGNLGRATMRGLMGGEKGRESDVAKV